MKVSEMLEIKEVFEVAGILVSLLCGAHEIKKGTVAVKSTACTAITDAVDIVGRDLGVGFKAFPGRRLLRPGPQ